jgi:hypothetical protein
MADLMVNSGLIGQTNAPCTEKNKKTIEAERKKNPSKEKESTLPVWEKEKHKKLLMSATIFFFHLRLDAKLKSNPTKKHHQI